MSQRAYKLKLEEVQLLCTFFQLDQPTVPRHNCTSKEAFINRLLDFLGAPDISFVKPIKNIPPTRSILERTSETSRKRKSATTLLHASHSRHKTDEAWASSDSSGEEVVGADHDNNEVSENEDDKQDKNNPSPLLVADGSDAVSDKALRRWVKAYVACFNMDKATIQHAIITASDKFGVNIASKKEKLKQMLTEEL